MGFPENILTKDEKVVRTLHPHWLTVLMPTILGIVIIAAAAVIVWLTPVDPTWDIVDWVVIAIAVIALLWFVLVPFLRWRTTHYVFTNKRVAVRRGILSKSGQDIALSKITDVSFHQSLLDRITRSGTLNIETAGDSDDEDFNNIPRSNEVQQLLNRLIEDDSAARGGFGMAAFQGHHAPPSTEFDGPVRDRHSAPPSRGRGDTSTYDTPPPQSDTRPPQDAWETGRTETRPYDAPDSHGGWETPPAR
ncbi:PH domain-containing protein [Cumulibacter soli]|uniref:PH domain-containing protein n=1 Tax=Cumulibacter soli TaxID=2546344 RepID=UPI00106844E0|nr:PH domain-containing protein [Cumulibacter soli]